MHVLRLGSKSVNYANRIIMQETKAPDNSYLVSHQLMKNISLSNLSDVDTIQSNDDADEAGRLRKFSSDRAPAYGNQLNYSSSFEHLEQRRKPSADFRYGITRSKAFPNREEAFSVQLPSFLKIYFVSCQKLRLCESRVSALLQTFTDGIASLH